MAKQEAAAEKKQVGLADQMGALLYYAAMKKAKKEAKSFEGLSDEDQAPYTLQAIEFIQILDKLNLVLGPRPDLKKEQETEQQHLEVLMGIIKKFVDGLKTTKPQLFPVEELARKILAGGK